jgi:hypothetical protein
VIRLLLSVAVGVLAGLIFLVCLETSHKEDLAFACGVIAANNHFLSRDANERDDCKAIRIHAVKAGLSSVAAYGRNEQ